jgi:hypothetical protein
MKKHCANCGAFVDKEDMREYEGKWYCDDCATTCDDCGEVHLRDEMTYIDGYSRLVCESCLDDNYIYCDDCERYEHIDHSYYIDSEDRYVCENCYSDNYATCNGCGYATYIDNLRWSDYDEAYYCQDCYESNCDDERPTFDYHSGLGRGNISENYRYRVGVELEREDEDFLDCIDKNRYLNDYGWVIEYDGSLSSGGFEAVSPVLPLKIGKLIDDFNKEDLKDLVRADFSSRCGGHITISDIKRTPNELIDDIAGYLPMLYALFPNRTLNSYCSPRGKDEYKVGGRYALHTRGCEKGCGLEIRLFDAPKDEKDLINRFRLVKYMLQHKAITIEQGLKELSDSNKLRSVIKYHLKTYNISYQDFYANIVKYARDIDKVRVRINTRNIDKFLNR